MRIAFLAALICFLQLASGISASVIAGPVTNPVNGHAYYLLSPDTWSGSEATAVAMGGTLATVRSADEDLFLYTTFGANRNLWIGFVDTQGDRFVPMAAH